MLKAALGATRLFGAAPSIVQPEEALTLGADGSPEENYRDEIKISANTHVGGLSESLQFGASDEGGWKVGPQVSEGLPCA